MDSNEKKIVLRVSLAIFVTILAIAGIVIAQLWTRYYPKRLAQGARDNEKICQYLISVMPELEGASTTEITFSKRILYEVSYHGKTYVVGDTAVQNNIDAFSNVYTTCDYKEDVMGFTELWTLLVLVLAVVFSAYPAVLCFEAAKGLIKEKRAAKRLEAVA